jgi:hypothetical protein
MKLPRRNFLHLAACAAALPVATRQATALDYPTRPVRVIVGFTAGSAPDIVARLMGQWLSERLGQQFLVWCWYQHRRRGRPWIIAASTRPQCRHRIAFPIGRTYGPRGAVVPK